MLTPENKQDNSFVSRVAVDADFNCWLWTGALRNGKPIFYDSVTKETPYAVRWVWTRMNGSIPDGGILRRNHKCGSKLKLCVNPEHYTLHGGKDVAPISTVKPPQSLEDALVAFEQLSQKEASDEAGSTTES